MIQCDNHVTITVSCPVVSVSSHVQGRTGPFWRWTLRSRKFCPSWTWPWRISGARNRSSVSAWGRFASTASREKTFTAYIYLYISPSGACVCLITGSCAWREITWHDYTPPDTLVFTSLLRSDLTEIHIYVVLLFERCRCIFVFVCLNLGATWDHILTCLHDVMSSMWNWQCILGKTSQQLHPAGREDIRTGI